MKKRAREFQEGYNNYITDGEKMPEMPTTNQSQFLEKANKISQKNLKEKMRL